MAKKKVYNGKELMQASRFVNFYATMTESGKQSVLARIDALIAENSE